MSSYVSIEPRRLVAARARGLCEYCLIQENDTFFGCRVDHIITEKHGGLTTAENLASACAFFGALSIIKSSATFGVLVNNILPSSLVYLRVTSKLNLGTVNTSPALASTGLGFAVRFFTEFTVPLSVAAGRVLGRISLVSAAVLGE